MNSEIKFKANTGQINIDEAQGIVECFVAGIGNKDSVGDIVISGAFTKSLTRRKPRVVWGHNWNDPIGKVLEIYEVPSNDPRLPSKMKAAGIGGLFAKVQFNLNSEKGKEAFANIAFFGEEQEWSIGYKTLDAIYDNTRQANVLREVELYEVSPVLHGANQLTGTISVKSEEEKMHMYATSGSPMPIVEKPKGPVDPFAQGVAQPADSDRVAALERELTSRTGGPIKVMKATESSVMFMKPGKGMFRLGYYFDGEQWMFGKPEQLGPSMMNLAPRPVPTPSIPALAYSTPRSPENPSVVFGTVMPKNDEKTAMDELDFILDEINQETKVGRAINSRTVNKLKNVIETLQEIVGSEVETKSDFIVECEPKFAFKTKQLLDPVFDYHRVETLVTENGILITSEIDNEAYQAIETATKGIGRLIGRSLGGGGKGKARRARGALSKITGELNPQKRRDIDNDGLIFDGTWREMPAPTKMPTRSPVARSSGLRSNSNPSKFTTSMTRPIAEKLIKAIDTTAAPGSEINPDSVLGRIKQSLVTNRYKGSIQIDFDPQDIAAALSEIEGQDASNADIKYLKDSLNKITENKGGELRARKGGGGRRMGSKTQTRLVKPPATGSAETSPRRVEIAKRMADVQPNNWRLMSLPEKENWLLNEAPTLGLSEEVRSRQLDMINTQMLADEEATIAKAARAKRLERLKAERLEKEKREGESRTQTKPKKEKPNPEKPESSDESEEISKFLKATERLRQFLDANESGRGNVRKLLDKQTRETLAAVDSELGDGETAESLKNAENLISNLLSEMQLDLTEASTVKEGKLKEYLEIIASSMAARRAELEEIEKPTEITRELNPLNDLIGATGGDDDISDVVFNSINSATNYLTARSRRKQGSSGVVGLRSRTSTNKEKAPRTQINAEATWWNEIETSLPKEISKATDDKTRKGLELLQSILRRQESGKLGSTRTNAGSLTITADEADQILDAVMSVVDRQVSSSGSRGKIFAELLEKIAGAAMSTFIEKTTPSVGATKRTVENSRGQSVTIRN